MMIYGLKSEVAVSANAPHYCQFVQPHCPGSHHDYQIQKQVYVSYLQYLLKTPEEADELPGDTGSHYWAVMEDKAYIGPQTDTPDFRRITPVKAPATPQQQQSNTEISRDRVPIEQFFGRLTASWGIIRDIYQWDHFSECHL